MSEPSKAAFAAAANQLFNETKADLGTKSFNFTMGQKLTATPTPAPTASAKPVNIVFGSGLTSRVKQAKPGINDEPKPSNVSDIFSKFAKKNDGNLFASCNSALNASTSSDWLNGAKTSESSVKVDTEVAVKLTTGEENEKNRLNVTCKIYQYDNETKAWKERGPCNVHLNETDEVDADGNKKARLVARSSGTQKVIINSLLFPEMVFEVVSEKRIKISAHAPETDLPQLFLVSSTPHSIGVLSAEIRKRTKVEPKTLETPVLSRKRKVEKVDDAENGADGDNANNANGKCKRTAADESPKTTKSA